MSGIGDIIAIAQLGYNFAEGLKSYIDEVGAAHESVKALVIEVEQASDHVRGLSELIDGDNNTGFLTPVGLKECRRLSLAFQETIFEFRSRLLIPDHGQKDPEEAAAEFLDLSRWRRWQWPIFRRTLNEPRARLGELKVELQLLMVMATAHKLSKMPLTQEVEKKQEDAQAKLKRLTRIKEKAASRHRKAQVRQSTRAPRAGSLSPEVGSVTSTSSDSSFSSDDDMLEYFVEFLDAKKQTAELERRDYQLYLMRKELEAQERIEREKRLLARAEQLEEEAERQKRREQARKEVLEDLAKERVMRETMQKQHIEQIEQIHGAMEEAGFEEEKLKEVLGKIKEITTPEVRPDPFTFLKSQEALSEKTQSSSSTTSEPVTVSSSRQSKTRNSLFRWKDSKASSMVSYDDGEGKRSALLPALEAWSLETPRIRVPLPVPTLMQMVKKQNHRAVLRNFSSLPRATKDEFQELMEEKKHESSQYTWQLVGMEITKHRVRIGLFSYAEGGLSVLVILERHDGGILEDSTKPTGPRGNKAKATLFTDADMATQRLTSILKRPVDSTLPERQPEIASSAEPRVRISPESPEVNYAEKDGTQDSTTDENLDKRAHASTSGSDVPYASTSRPDTYTPRALPPTTTRTPGAYLFDHFENGPDSYDDASRIRDRDRHRSSSRSSQRNIAQPYRRSYYGDDYDEDYFEYPAGRNYPMYRSNSRPRSVYLDPQTPNVGERFRRPNDPYHEYEPVNTRRNFLLPTPPRFPPRRSSTFDSFDDLNGFPGGAVPDRRPAPNVHIYNNVDKDTPERTRIRSPHWDILEEDDGMHGSPRRDRSFHRQGGSGPPPGGYGYVHRRSRSPFRRRSRSNSYDIMFPPSRKFFSNWSGDNRTSPPRPPPPPPPPPVPLRKTTLSPDDRNEMALVLRSYFENDDFEKLKKRAKKHAHRRSSMRKASDDGLARDVSESPPRGSRHSKGRKVTIEDYEESDSDAPEVLDKYQPMFNPDYEPPAAETVNGVSENQNGDTGSNDIWVIKSGSKKPPESTANAGSSSGRNSSLAQKKNSVADDPDGAENDNSFRGPKKVDTGVATVEVIYDTRDTEEEISLDSWNGELYDDEDPQHGTSTPLRNSEREKEGLEISGSPTSPPQPQELEPAAADETTIDDLWDFGFKKVKEKGKKQLTNPEPQNELGTEPVTAA